MKHLHLLIKPASSLCNMRCSYCFYADVSARRQMGSRGIMSRETAGALIGNVFNDLPEGDEITFAFQGGEPALAALAWFEDFVELAEARGRDRRVRVHYAFQTNGLLIDEDWCKFFRVHNFLIGLSLDGGAGHHDRNRRDSRGQGTFRAVLTGKKLLEEYGVEYNILCVLTNDLAGEPDKVWRFILQENIKYIQFIPCLDALDEPGASPFALRPPRFAAFYGRIFLGWLRELESGRYISVKFIDDAANFFFKGISSACGMGGQCQAQYVVEADGSVYPCDFYALDEYCTGNLTEKTLHQIFDSEKMQSFLRNKPPLPERCGSCKYIKFCGGGCKRMRNVMYCGSSGAVCGYGAFLDKYLGPLEYAIRRFLSP